MPHDADRPQHAPSYVTAYTLCSALGNGNAATRAALHDNRGGLREVSLRAGGTTWLGLTRDAADTALDASLASYDCRAHRLLGSTLAQDGFRQAVQRACAQYGAERVGCVVGTIASGLAHLETRYVTCQAHDDLGAHADVRLRQTAHLYSATEFCRHALGARGPSATLSTACSSSAKVFCTADRYLRAGLCDAVVVAGIDCANEGFIYGFRSLGLLSQTPCRPWDARRDGLSIGEAAGFALLERAPRDAHDIALLGYGESGDAYHMTAPHPQGSGARMAIEIALRHANLQPHDIDYINLHGSGTQSNDTSEDAAIHGVFGTRVPCSSTKGWTGHTQGAAGITEAILSFACIHEDLVPGMLNTDEPDPALHTPVVLRTEYRPVRRVLSNSFGFGGNNCALIFSSLA